MSSSPDCSLEPYFKKFASDTNCRSTHFDAKENFRLRVENMYMYGCRAGSGLFSDFEKILNFEFWILVA
jgi:hypothetical protein